MTSKVYWKSLILVLTTVKHYIQHWQVQLQANLTVEQYDCVIAVLDAVIACLIALPENNPT